MLAGTKKYKGFGYTVTLIFLFLYYFITFTAYVLWGDFIKILSVRLKSFIITALVIIAVASLTYENMMFDIHKYNKTISAAENLGMISDAEPPATVENSCI